MFKKKIKTKIIFYLIKSLKNFKKKKISILGPVGNYSYNILLKKINKKFILYPLINIKSLKNKNNKIIPYENNNGGIVRDCLELLFKKKIFINSIIIINIKHNFFLYKKKKIFFLHKQSYKQINKKILFFFKKIKTVFINSNSNINKGINICNYNTKKVFPINVKNINLKDNFINKTKFIINKNSSFKKKILSFFINNYFFFQKKITIYKKKKLFYFEIFINSFKNLLFIMKNIKNKIKILFTGFYNIL
ncbi:prephenate dehydratase domain-containing protein [Candidatus Carsonella ruddii]|uniref:Valyl-tRNA synthetase n=1 Tax=Carsonella ruddii TaxID=114186 RepID=A0A1U9RRD8_CARRU|nr:prephenate dehydratase domain-containing protein [Candidatus Carsonella ruddii]AQU89478.1 Valyl-tRNA synthetase [Candidatus Carsonella ruddii]